MVCEICEATCRIAEANLPSVTLHVDWQIVKAMTQHAIADPIAMSTGIFYVRYILLLMFYFLATAITTMSSIVTTLGSVRYFVELVKQLFALSLIRLGV
jgi:hypothetical protein